MKTLYINRNDAFPYIREFINDVVKTMSLESDNPSPFKNMVRKIYFDLKFAVCKEHRLLGSDHPYIDFHLDETQCANIQEYTFELDIDKAWSQRIGGLLLDEGIFSFCTEAYPKLEDGEVVTLIGFTPRLKKTIFAIPKDMGTSTEDNKEKMMKILSWFKTTIEKLLDRHNLIPVVQSYDGKQVEEGPESNAEEPTEVTVVNEAPVETEATETETNESVPSVEETPAEMKVVDDVVETTFPEEIARNLDDNFVGEESLEEMKEEYSTGVDEPDEEPADKVEMEMVTEAAAEEKGGDVAEAPLEEEAKDVAVEEDVKTTEPVNDVADFPFEGGTPVTKDLLDDSINSQERGSTDYPLRQFALGIRNTYSSEGGLVIPLDRVVMVKLEKDEDSIRVYLEHNVDVVLKNGNAIDFLKNYQEYMNYY